MPDLASRPSSLVSSKSAPLILILGPCSLESYELSARVAEVLATLQAKAEDIQIYFKGSYDKANRTSLGSERGPGLEEGLTIHQKIKDQFGLPCLTDIHSPSQASTVAEVCDVLQIPAFLCRQTDLLTAAAATDAIVNVKKGQFLSPYEMPFVVKKLEDSGAKGIWQTERGTTFGYQNLVVDMRSFPLMAANGHPTIMDATHAVQMPGAGAGTTSGRREFVPSLAKAALAAGARGVFLETHPDPNSAVSDGPNQVPLEQLGALLDQLVALWRLVSSQEDLDIQSA
ncbi:MAG: 3-deoxy-8-phosphooctulonate synthase [Verrucomicrobiota bacterium]